MYKYCSWTWWPPKKKKKGQHPLFHGLCNATAVGLYFCKFFSALQIKDNSKFNKGQGQGVQIKDCPLK